MGFGAIIATGDKNEFLAGDLFECITEVRVEQFLNEPAMFAIQFQEDISGGEPRIMSAAPLQPDQMITIAVKVGDDMKCLVRGPITEVKCSIMLGGTGSSLTVTGQDRRVELDRMCAKQPWDGLECDAAKSILDGYGFTSMVEPTVTCYGEDTTTLNQRGTDLEFLTMIADVNNYKFWLTYTCEAALFPPGALCVEETANIRSSPERPPSGPGALASVADIVLRPSTDIRLRVNVDKTECQNVTAFDMNMDVERPNCFTGTALNDKDLAEDATTAEDVQQAVEPGGCMLSEMTDIERDVCITTAGDASEVQCRANAALTDAGWYVTATASTTLNMLGGVLAPHDVVEVDGLGSALSVPFRVKAATHVINAAELHSDYELETNAIGGK